jgi:putative transposase
MVGERFATHEAMKATAFTSIEVFYNRRRLHATLADTPPIQCLATWRTDQHNHDPVV